MPKQIIASDGSIWRPLGGLSRRYENVLTGEVIARRQFDRRYGSLAKGGFRSYEQKAKASPIELRRARPAFNRPSITNRKDVGVIARLRPLTEKSSRQITLPFNQITYQNAIKQASKNGKILALSVSISFQGDDGLPRTPTIINLTAVHSMPSWPKFLEKIGEISFEKSAADFSVSDITSMTFNIRFKHETIPQSKRKRDKKKRDQLKVKAQKRKARNKFRKNK